VKCIVANLITDVIASSSNANYRESNLLDEHPKKKWISEETTATLSMTVAANASALALFATNADSITFSIADTNGMAWEEGGAWEPGGSWYSTGAGSALSALDGRDGACWFEWTPVNYPIVVTATLASSAGAMVEAGVAWAGVALPFSAPSYPLRKKPVDYSRVTKLSNGADYAKTMDMVRGYAITADMSPAEYESFFSIVYAVRQKRPFAWLLVDFAPAVIFFGRFDTEPAGEWTSLNRHTTSFDLLGAT